MAIHTPYGRKRAAVVTALRAAAPNSISDDTIAAKVGCSKSYVAIIRRETLGPYFVRKTKGGRNSLAASPSVLDAQPSDSASPSPEIDWNLTNVDLDELHGWVPGTAASQRRNEDMRNSPYEGDRRRFHSLYYRAIYEDHRDDLRSQTEGT